MKRDILLLGNPQLYEVSLEVEKDSLTELQEIVADLHDTLMAYRDQYGAGRAIAAPQIGVQKRLIYMYIDQPTVFINPILTFPDDETMDVLDDCMSFPGLYVQLKRFRRCKIEYVDTHWKKCVQTFEGDLSELIQHEYDHLDGILATMRANDNRSLVMKSLA